MPTLGRVSISTIALIALERAGQNALIAAQSRACHDAGDLLFSGLTIDEQERVGQSQPQFVQCRVVVSQPRAERENTPVGAGSLRQREDPFGRFSSLEEGVVGQRQLAGLFGVIADVLGPRILRPGEPGGDLAVALAAAQRRLPPDKRMAKDAMLETQSHGGVGQQSARDRFLQIGDDLGHRASQNVDEEIELDHLAGHRRNFQRLGRAPGQTRDALLGDAEETRRQALQVGEVRHRVDFAVGDGSRQFGEQEPVPAAHSLERSHQSRAALLGQVRKLVIEMFPNLRFVDWFELQDGRRRVRADPRQPARSGSARRRRGHRQYQQERRSFDPFGEHVDQLERRLVRIFEVLEDQGERMRMGELG